MDRRGFALFYSIAKKPKNPFGEWTGFALS
jgi:hypothetical protein